VIEEWCATNALFTALKDKAALVKMAPSTMAVIDMMMSDFQ